MKVIICLIGFVFFYLFLGNATALVIPEDALRIRVIPNSNESVDIEVKNIVKEQLQFEMYELLKNVDDVYEANDLINLNLKNIENNVREILDESNYNNTFTINYGLNYFPHKEYKGVVYKEGYYDSLVVTIGEGKGDNWWCVLYPPLCLIEEDMNAEYTTYVKELLDEHM